MWPHFFVPGACVSDASTGAFFRLLDFSTRSSPCHQNHTARHLVLEVHARGARLDHQFRELHHRGQAAVARVAVGDDRRQEVRLGLAGPQGGLPGAPVVVL